MNFFIYWCNVTCSNGSRCIVLQCFWHFFWFRYSYLTGRYFFCSRFYFENDFEIFFISFFPPLFFQFYFIFLVSVACLVLEYISLRILQNQINMFGVLVVVLVVQFTKTKVAIHANVSWSYVASRSVSFWEVFFLAVSELYIKWTGCNRHGRRAFEKLLYRRELYGIYLFSV